ncbi:Aste57867_13622 [Aphanomyces stellatus]|uniref:Aste57867_13622 protein n=1 Tax=Aphanomyces stellatus TaxID=120398 RepID=A0A485KYY6_9STRA|nr:hypothetical protein As57867_013572 [Aphanomyces stellatus]VFT90459.1 Aste57867_13622 [Aphanomyces stellatus]
MLRAAARRVPPRRSWRRWSSTDADRMALSPEQQRILDDHRFLGPNQVIVVEGTPGSGKSVAAAALMMETSMQMLHLAPSSMASSIPALKHMENQTRLGFLDASPHLRIHTMAEWCQTLTAEFGSSPQQKIMNHAETRVFLLQFVDSLPWTPLRSPYKSSQALRTAIRDLLHLFQHLESQGISHRAFALYVRELCDDETAMTADAFADFVAKQTELSGAYSAYRELLHTHDVNTWHGTMLDAHVLLQDNPFYLHTVANMHDIVLVDDLHAMTPAMLKILAQVIATSPHKRCIAFTRPSNNTTILDKMLQQTSTTEVTTHTLPINLYTSPTIAEAAHCVATDAPVAAAPPVECHHFASVADEVRFFASYLPPATHDHGVTVVCAEATAVSQMVQALHTRGVPAQSLEKADVFESRVIRTAHALLVALANPSEPKHVFSLLQLSTAISPRALAAIMETQQKIHMSLVDLLANVVADDAPASTLAVDDATRHTLRAFLARFGRMQDLAMEKSCLELLQLYFTDTGELTALLDPVSDADAAASQALAAYFHAVGEAQRATEALHVPFVVPYLRQLRDNGRLYLPSPEPEPNHVHVVSLATATRRPFLTDTLAIVGMNDKAFPGRKPRQPNVSVLPRALFAKSQAPSSRNEYLDECRDVLAQMLLRAKSRVILSASSETPSRTLAPLWQSPTIHPPQKEESNEEVDALVQDRSQEAPRHVDYVSYSQIDEYTRCPHRYYLSRVLQLAPPMAPGLVYGRSLHEGIAAWSRLPASLSATSDALEAFTSSWETGCFRSKAEEMQLFDQAQATLLSFIDFEETHKGGTIIEAVELPFEVDLPEANVRLKGVWDRIEQREDGVYVVEFKSNLSNGPRNNQKLANESLQLQLYMLAYARQYGVAPAGGVLRSLESPHGRNSEGIVPYASSTDAAVLEVVSTTAARIRAREFDPLPSYLGCAYCPFADVCASKI